MANNAEPDDAKHETKNMRGKKQELVLAGKECLRVYWMPVLARGKLHIEMLGSDFRGDHVDGMPLCVCVYLPVRVGVCL